MDISFTGKTFRSAGDLFIQTLVNGKVVSCIVTSEALAQCAPERQNASAEEIYQLHRASIERIASKMILSGVLAPVMVRGRDLAALHAAPLHGRCGPAA